MISFWEQLREQGLILGLSPMDGVTDAPMRYMVAKHGHNPRGQSVRTGVDVLFTEFVSVDGLHYAQGERRERILKAFVKVGDIEPGINIPEVAQIFGKTPEFFAEAASLIETLGFDGVDINMGCPAHNVSESGSGAGLIRTPELAQAIVKAVRAATHLPVSVKTRIGVDAGSEMEEWIAALSEVRPDAISLHGRTLRQMYTGNADWEAIGRAARIVHDKGGIILGNGDVRSLDEAKSRASESGVDGVLIGRASFGNPGVFVNSEPDWETRKSWILEHAKIYGQVFGQEYFLPLRKHLAWYARGFPGASELRQELVRVNKYKDVKTIIERYTG